MRSGESPGAGTSAVSADSRLWAHRRDVDRRLFLIHRFLRFHAPFLPLCAPRAASAPSDAIGMPPAHAVAVSAGSIRFRPGLRPSIASVSCIGRMAPWSVKVREVGIKR
jgi:hypothetical protein